MALPTKQQALNRFQAYLNSPDTPPEVKDYIRARLREEPFNDQPDDPLAYAIGVFTQDPAEIDLTEATQAMAQVTKWWADMPES